MNILLLGQGGRENALAWKMSQSELLNKLYIAPGNAGTVAYGDNVNIAVNDFDSIKQFVLSHDINMLVVGPEDPLVNGVYDFFVNDKDLAHIKVIGPSKDGAKLEGSKDFAKQFMNEFGIPTAKYKSFTSDELDEAFLFLDSMSAPYVLKADGLAAGKGVLIINDIDEAKSELRNMFSGMFGDAGKRVVIEEFLSGIECSVFVLTDNEGHYKILPVAKDYKRIGEGDTGLNTGGMGAISPVSFANEDFMQKVEKRIVIPTIEGIKTRGFAYKGFVFIGLIAVNGEPYVIEYNVRMGDPETEVVMPRIQSDLVQLLQAVGDGNLHTVPLVVDPRYAVTIMLVAGGYPGDYRKGDEISGLDKVKDSLLFHAGTKQQGNGIVTNGGRVLALTSYGNTKDEALKKSFENANLVTYKDKYYRRDIGFDLK